MTPENVTSVQINIFLSFSALRSINKKKPAKFRISLPCNPQN